MDPAEASTGRLPPALSNENLRRRMLPPLTSEELDGLHYHLAEVTAGVRRWCADHSVLDRALVLPAALWAIVQAPRFSRAALTTTVQAAIWALAVDDLFDNGLAGSDELAEVVRECTRVACGPQKASRIAHPLAVILAEIEADLSSYPLWPQLHPVWATSLSKMFDGMLYEYELQRRMGDQPECSMPTLDEYLYFAGPSSTVPHQWMGALVLAGDPSVVPALPGLIDLAGECGVVIRLANDLASFERERAERRVNGVVIAEDQLREGAKSAAGRDDPGGAAQLLKRRLQVERQKAIELAGGITTTSCMERRFLRSAEFGVELYALQDLRDLSSTLFVGLAP